MLHTWFRNTAVWLETYFPMSFEKNLNKVILYFIGNKNSLNILLALFCGLFLTLITPSMLYLPLNFRLQYNSQLTEFCVNKKGTHTIPFPLHLENSYCVFHKKMLSTLVYWDCNSRGGWGGWGETGIKWNVPSLFNCLKHAHDNKKFSVWIFGLSSIIAHVIHPPLFIIPIQCSIMLACPEQDKTLIMSSGLQRKGMQLLFN